MSLAAEYDRPVVWSDFAGVLTPPLAHTMAVFCDRIGVPEKALRDAIEKVTARFGTRDFMMPLDTPLVTEEEWLRQVAEHLPAAYAARVPKTSIADLWFDGRMPNQRWVDHLLELRRRGLFVGLLSNMTPEWDAHWRRMVPVTELFDDVILSFAVGTRKPERAIYELATRRAGAAPAQCVFVDDQVHNVEAARAYGWTAIHFTSTDSAIARLDEAIAARADRNGGLP